MIKTYENTCISFIKKHSKSGIFHSNNFNINSHIFNAVQNRFLCTAFLFPHNSHFPQIPPVEKSFYNLGLMASAQYNVPFRRFSNVTLLVPPSIKCFQAIVSV